MQSIDLDKAASRVVNYLRAEKAYRISEEEIGGFKTVMEICEALDLYCGNWTQIKTHMLKLGVHICYQPGQGHYLGAPGEEVTNTVFMYKIAKGWASRVGKYAAAIKAASPEAVHWINRRFKDLEVSEVEDERPEPVR